MIRIEIDGVKKGESIFTQNSSTNIQLSDVELAKLLNKEEFEAFKKKSEEINAEIFVAAIIDQYLKTKVIAIKFNQIITTDLKDCYLSNYISLGSISFESLAGNTYFTRGICDLANLFTYNMHSKEINFDQDITTKALDAANCFLANWVSPPQQIKEVEEKLELFTI